MPGTQPGWDELVRTMRATRNLRAAYVHFQSLEKQLLGQEDLLKVFRDLAPEVFQWAIETNDTRVVPIDEVELMAGFYFCGIQNPNFVLAMAGKTAGRPEEAKAGAGDLLWDLLHWALRDPGAKREQAFRLGVRLEHLADGQSQLSGSA